MALWRLVSWFESKSRSKGIKRSQRQNKNLIRTKKLCHLGQIEKDLQEDLQKEREQNLTKGKENLYKSVKNRLLRFCVRRFFDRMK